jgi:hypothetical protein
VNINNQHAFNFSSNFRLLPPRPGRLAWVRVTPAKIMLQNKKLVTNLPLVLNNRNKTKQKNKTKQNKIQIKILINPYA